MSILATSWQLFPFRPQLVGAQFQLVGHVLLLLLVSLRADSNSFPRNVQPRNSFWEKSLKLHAGYDELKIDFRQLQPKRSCGGHQLSPISSDQLLHIVYSIVS